MSKLFSDMLDLLKDDYFPHISSQTTTRRCAPPEITKTENMGSGNRELNPERRERNPQVVCAAVSGLESNQSRLGPKNKVLGGRSPRKKTPKTD